MTMDTEVIQSKNWPETKWKPRQSIIFPAADAPKPNIVFPRIKDLPISQELALSKPIKLPELEFRITSTLDHEQYDRLSTMIRTNVFPGYEAPTCTSSYSDCYSNPFDHEDCRVFNASAISKDHRRKKIGFSKRLEGDLAYKRLLALWRQYDEDHPYLFAYDQRMKGGAKASAAEPRPIVQQKQQQQPPRKKKKKIPPITRKLTPLPNPEEPVIPEPDLGDMDIFKSNKTPDWAKDSDSIPEELDRPSMDNEQFWAFYDDPF